MISAFTSIVTQGGAILARDGFTGTIASCRTLDEAFAELRRLMARKPAA